MAVNEKSFQFACGSASFNLIYVAITNARIDSVFEERTKERGIRDMENLRKK